MSDGMWIEFAAFKGWILFCCKIMVNHNTVYKSLKSVLSFLTFKYRNTLRNKRYMKFRILVFDLQFYVTAL